MEKKTTQMIKGMAIIIMITHHFIVMPFLSCRILSLYLDMPVKYALQFMRYCLGMAIFSLKRKQSDME